MDDESNPLADDPQIAALLDFEPVVRKCKRHDGWTADNQRAFIAGLAETGSVDLAAQAIGRTASGAWKVRSSADAAGFAAAWDKALNLHEARHGGRRQGRPRAGWAPAPAADPTEAETEAMFDSILRMYWLKLTQEREARLAGRIVAADYYVRQLTWLEVALDLGGRGPELVMALKRGGRPVGKIVATPMSVLLDGLRRAWWRGQGEPERPPLAALGAHDGEISTGEPPDYEYYRERDGDRDEWRRRQDEKAALAAAAQAAWEEKARKDAAAWRARVGAGDAAAPGTEP